MIEGNALSPKEIEKVLKHEGHFPGRERDENEIKGYYAAITQVEKLAAASRPLTEKTIQILHAVVMASGKTKVTPTPYRNDQNVIRDGRTKEIIYMPPEAKDVPGLMEGLVDWIDKNSHLPCAIVAGIAHYQFATIHGESHNYYRGRAQADITQWIEYFVEGMAVTFENVLKRMNEANMQGSPDQSALIRNLDPRQRKGLELLQAFETITSSQIGELFGFKPRTSAQICKLWMAGGFLEIANPSNRAHKYKISKQYECLIKR